MRPGDRYMVKYAHGVSIMEVVVCFSLAVKVKWKTGLEEWLWLSSFKPANAYVDPDYVIIEVLN